MDFIGLLRGYMQEKTRVIVNGLGAGDTKGTILAVHDDYIEFELLNIQKEVKSGKEKIKREVQYIPLTSISSLSKGENEKTNETGLEAFCQ